MFFETRRRSKERCRKLIINHQPHRVLPVEQQHNQYSTRYENNILLVRLFCHSRTHSNQWMRMLAITLCSIITLFAGHVHATGVACTKSADCEKAIPRNGSVCMPTGFCSNPFHNKGCLAKTQEENQLKNSTNKNYIRVCSSSDPPEAEVLGYCIPVGEYWDYMEIRFMSLNWESAFFETWIMQIILSEILGVPTSVDTGYADLSVDFYDINSRFDYGEGYNYDAFRTAQQIQDCRLVEQSTNQSNYKSCAHVSLEIWEGQRVNLEELQEEGIIEKPISLGALGHISWFLPKFTGERDPTLLSYLGLAGEENRQKLAETFKRPTKWIDYCGKISATNCSTPDSYAQRAPENDEEAGRMYAEGLFSGYFRQTEKNNCVLNPTNCTGHIADFPCGWDSFLKQQAYHLNIALESDGDEPFSGGYTYSQLTEIWAAANATKSDVMMLWWTPEALYQTYLGTEAEFMRVSLPPPTQYCYDNRANPADRCSGKPELVFGTAAGACDDEPHPLMKVMTKNVYETSYGPNVPEERRSPAYDAIKNFEISSLQLGVIFDKWIQTNFDKWNYDPREATCQWVSENFDLIQSFVPRTYPRVLQYGEHAFNEPLFYVALVVAILSMILIFAICVATYKRRRQKSISIAQVEFLSLLLIGLLLVQIGSILLVIPPSNISCTMMIWFQNLGYTLELTPLLIKIAAINRLMAAAKNMRRVKIKRKVLFGAVAGFTFGMAVFLMLWTILSPPQETTKYELTKDLTEHGEAIVELFNYCHSENSFWGLLALGWRSVLLLWAIMLAFQSRNSPVNLNESKTLALMVYSKFVFLLLSIILFFLTDYINVSKIPKFESLVRSLDVIFVCCIYFIPKLLLSDEEMKANYETNRMSMRFSSFASPSSLNMINIGSQNLEGSDQGDSSCGSNQGTHRLISLDNASFHQLREAAKKRKACEAANSNKPRSLISEASFADESESLSEDGKKTKEASICELQVEQNSSSKRNSESLDSNDKDNNVNSAGVDQAACTGRISVTGPSLEV